MSEDLLLVCIVNWFGDQPEDCDRNKLSGVCITHRSDWCPFCIAASDDDDVNENGFWEPDHVHDQATLDRLRNHPVYSFS